MPLCYFYLKYKNELYPGVLSFYGDFVFDFLLKLVYQGYRIRFVSMETKTVPNNSVFLFLQLNCL